MVPERATVMVDMLKMTRRPEKVIALAQPGQWTRTVDLVRSTRVPLPVMMSVSPPMRCPRGVWHFEQDQTAGIYATSTPKIRRASS